MHLRPLLHMEQITNQHRRCKSVCKEETEYIANSCYHHYSKRHRTKRPRALATFTEQSRSEQHALLPCTPMMLQFSEMQCSLTRPILFSGERERETVLMLLTVRNPQWLMHHVRQAFFSFFLVITTSSTPKMAPGCIRDRGVESHSVHAVHACRRGRAIPNSVHASISFHCIVRGTEKVNHPNWVIWLATQLFPLCCDISLYTWNRRPTI